MSTIGQIFSNAGYEARRNLPSHPSANKALSRLEIDDVLQIQHELAQHFETWFRQVCDTVDVNRPGRPTIGERIARITSMRTINPKEEK
jgi:hypothetical protein